MDAFMYTRLCFGMDAFMYTRLCADAFIDPIQIPAGYDIIYYLLNFR